MKISKISHLTGEYNTREIDITIDQYNDWQNVLENKSRRPIQDVLPNLSADDREFMISGITPDEWDNAFGSDDI